VLHNKNFSKRFETSSITNYLNVLFCFSIFISSAYPVFAQKDFINGKVLDAKNAQPLVGVSVSFEKNKQKGTFTDENGLFRLEKPSQKATLIFSFIGYEKQKVEILADDNSFKNIQLVEKTSELNEVVVKGLTQEQAEVRDIKLNVNPVTIITAKQIENRAGNLNEVLARQAGIQIRQSGGLGSEARISVRGLEGKRVQIFLDGNPLNSPDGSLGINDFPVQIIERIEIYKGSVPAWLGGDGLGSAVNVVLRHRDVSYIDAGLTRQSFNTQIASLILKKTFDKQGIEVGAGVFDTRSDNDFVMQSPFQSDLRIKRDHDKYHSVLAGGAIRFHKLWFDEAEIEGGYITNNRQIQGIARNIQHVESRGEAGVIAMNLTKKEVIKDNLGLKYTLILGRFNVKLIDTSSYNYNWDGSRFPSLIGKGELGIGPNLTTTIQQELRHRINLDYKLGKNFTLNLNNTARIASYEPSDEVANEFAGRNVTNFPGDLKNSVTGLTLESRWLKDKLLLSTAVKHYFNLVNGYNTSVYIGGSGTNPDKLQAISNLAGYVAGLRYNLSKTIFIKASHERGIRLPNNQELFGDGILITPNTGLKPEIANNNNLGFVYDKANKRGGRLQIEANGFYMNVEQLIQLSGNGLALGYVNYAKANILGADIDVKYDITKNIYAGFNATWQRLKDINKFITGTQDVPNPTYGLIIPNTPRLFFNWSAEYHKENTWGKDSKTRLMYDGSFVDEYSYGFNISVYDNLNIPRFLTHTFSVEQSFRNNKYTIVAEANNITNANVVNNFAQPLAGRTFRIKLRYLLLGKPFDSSHSH
jgi:vitamin B12 transporter